MRETERNDSTLQLLIIFSSKATSLYRSLIMESLDEPPKTGNVDVLDLIPCLGLCCCFLSCYTELPDCLGTVCETTLCCFNTRGLLCKTGKEEEIVCRCLSCECDVISCQGCMKSRSQICCLDLRASFPPNEQNPCLLNVLCCTVGCRLCSFYYCVSLFDHLSFYFSFSCSAASTTMPPVSSAKIFAR